MEDCKIQENETLIKKTQNDLECFNTLSVKMLISKYSSLEDSTPIIILLIKEIPVSKINKLIRIVLDINNYNLEEIQKLSLDRHRKIRFFSTQLIYKYILHNYKSNNFREINELFKNTFLKRYKDVDPSIRAISYTFLINFINLNTKLFNKHKSLIKQGLTDKNDIVRKAIISELRIVDLEIDIKMIIEISKHDKSKIIRIESYKFLFNKYLQTSIITDENIFESLEKKEGHEKIINKDFDSLLTKVFNKMLQTDFLNQIHKIFQNCKDYINLVYLKEPFECDCSDNCYLKILEIQQKKMNISKLYEIYKENINNFDIIISLLLYAEIDNTETFINFLEDLYKNITVREDLIQFENLCRFFKSIENDYKTIIENIINRLISNKEYKYILIKYFDISNYVTDEDYLETQIYKYLWDIINEKYYKIKNISEDLNYKNKKEICNLLLMIKDKLNKNIHQSYIQDTVFDNISGLNILYFKLIKITRNLLDDADLLMYIYKFNEEEVLEDQVFLLYKFIENSLDFSDMFTRSQNKRNLVKSYFVFLQREEILINRDNLILEISKTINLKFRDKSDGLFFKNIKNVLEADKSCKMYKYLETFISKLNINECIVLENIAMKSKFRQILIKKIDKTKALKSSEDNVTYL